MGFGKRVYCRWENPLNSRFYAAHVQRDLLGDWVVVVCWGKRESNLGRLKSIFCETEKNAFVYLKKIGRERIRHGYVLMMNEGKLLDE